MSSKNLPALPELHYNLELAKKQGQLKSWLNKKPNKNWIKKHPIAKVKVDGKDTPSLYIGIAQVETLLDQIFVEWRVEVVRFDAIFNSVAVQIRLHYINPITGEWSYHDGLGAVGIQTDKGASASDLSAIKSDAVMKALPAAESYAIKDAAHKLGDLFGRNLNRQHNDEYMPVYSTEDGRLKKERQRLVDWLKSGTMTLANLDDVRRSENFKRYEDDAEIIALMIEIETTL